MRSLSGSVTEDRKTASSFHVSCSTFRVIQPCQPCRSSANSVASLNVLNGKDRDVVAIDNNSSSRCAKINILPTVSLDFINDAIAIATLSRLWSHESIWSTAQRLCVVGHRTSFRLLNVSEQARLTCILCFGAKCQEMEFSSSHFAAPSKARGSKVVIGKGTGLYWYKTLDRFER